MMKLHSFQKIENIPNDHLDHFIFPSSTSIYKTGILQVSKEIMMIDFDFGIPKSVKTNEDSDLLILYSNPQSLPHEWSMRHEAIFEKNSLEKDGVTSRQDIGKDNSSTLALFNCDTLNVIFPDSGFNQPSARTIHLAISGDFENCHKNHWSHIPQPPQDGYLNPFKIQMLNILLPLNHVGEIFIENEGIDEFSALCMQISQKKDMVYERWKSLQNFLDKY